MDKRVIFATAGSGKTTYIINSLCKEKRSLILTYTNNNYENLKLKILKKFDNIWPENITLMTYFVFLYRFCYKPFLSDEIKDKGINYNSSKNLHSKRNDLNHYIDRNKQLYSNRLSLLIEDKINIKDIENRITKYFDVLIIDEVQDISSSDFNLLKQFMKININHLYVGDFFQHIYNTSTNASVNKNLYKNIDSYEKEFSKNNFSIEKEILNKTWRCSNDICDFIKINLGIDINSNTNKHGIIEHVDDVIEINNILDNDDIVKLHYQNSIKYGDNHKNWGETKGEDCYQDVCVLLNEKTHLAYLNNNLKSLPVTTRNKLYVAITRAHRNVYLIKETHAKMKG
ncbi:MAG: UvrD-helicase domain-containing protein [Anaeroplasmataceae bacterium]